MDWFFKFPRESYDGSNGYKFRLKGLPDFRWLLKFKLDLNEPWAYGFMVGQILNRKKNYLFNYNKIIKNEYLLYSFDYISQY